MDAALRAEFGVEGDWHLARRHRVRWAECDMHAHVNHAAYFIYFEDLRVDHWLGLGQVLRAGEPGPVVAKLSASFRRALSFGDDILLTLRVEGMRNTSYQHRYAAWKGGLCFEAEALLVVVRDGASTPVPEPARSGMARLLGP